VCTHGQQNGQNSAALASLNHNLHDLYACFEETPVADVQLTITCARNLPVSQDEIRQYLSPAIVMAAFAPASTVSLSHAGSTAMTSLQKQSLRSLLKTLRELRAEVQLFNELHADAFGKDTGLKRCAAVGREFEVRKVNSHTKYYSLKSNAVLQECIDRARTSLKQRETEAVGFAEEMKELVRKWEKLQVMRSSRKGQL